MKDAMAKKTPKKKRNPQELTDYALRGLRNDIADLCARIEQLEQFARSVHVIQRPDSAA